MYKSFLIVCSLLLVLLGSSQVYALPPVSTSYLGAGDPGVDYFPNYLGLKMHIRCYSNVTTANANGPIALFDSGLPFFSTAWVSVIPRIMINMPAWNFSKACFMDRYGYGWSDPSIYPVTTQDFVFRLHGSLNVAGLTGKKYVLVGWSWGSIFVQTYALAYPTEVVGILTIDGTDSRWGFISENQQAVISLTNTFTGYMTKLSLGTLQADANAGLVPHGHGYFPNGSVVFGYTQDTVTASQQIWLTNQNLLTSIQELNIMVLSSAILNFTYTLKGSNPLKDLPYVSLYNTVTNQDWTDRQIFMNSLSTNSQSSGIATDHFFPWFDNDDIIVGLGALANRIATTPAVVWGQ